MLNNKSTNINNPKDRTYQIRKFCTLSLLTALAFLCVLFLRVPFTDFLSFEPKDAVIVISSFIYGPVSGIIMAVIVSLIEMFTISTTGPIGLIMNVISSIAFVLPVAIFYKKNKSIKNIIIGLIIGTLFMVISMILWNYLITPLYMGISREAVTQMLIPIFLPFNLIKGGINIFFVFMLFPLINVLKKANLIPKQDTNISNSKKSNILLIVLSIFILSSSILLILVLNGSI